MSDKPASTQEGLDFVIGLWKEDEGQVLISMTAKVQQIVLPPDVAIKMGQALIKHARQAQKRGNQIVLPQGAQLQ